MIEFIPIFAVFFVFVGVLALIARKQVKDYKSYLDQHNEQVAKQTELQKELVERQVEAIDRQTEVLTRIADTLERRG